MNLFNYDDTMDSRDIQDRIDELNEMETSELSFRESQELSLLQDLKNDIDSSEWDCGLTLINECYFIDYATELFNECYMHEIPTNLQCYIDYEAFARDLKMDYSCVEFNGETFYFLS